MKGRWQHFTLLHSIGVEREDSGLAKPRLDVGDRKGLLKRAFHYSRKIPLRYYEILFREGESFHSFTKVVFEALKHCYI